MVDAGGVALILIPPTVPRDSKQKCRSTTLLALGTRAASASTAHRCVAGVGIVKLLRSGGTAGNCDLEVPRSQKFSIIQMLSSRLEPRIARWRPLGDGRATVW